VKSKLLIALGLTAALVAPLGSGSRARAQGATQPGAASAAVMAMPQQTKVATLNLLAVMKGYKKVEIMNRELIELQDPFQTKGKELMKNYQGWKAVAEDPKKADSDREQAQKYMLTLKRQLEDLNAAMEKAVRGRQEEKLVQVYREIHDAVKAYAQAQGIHVVFQYHDGLDPAEIFNPRNIQRKLQGSGAAGAFVPLYIADGVDISQAVVSMLNSRFQPPPPGGQ
jgi:Skp family chaperone for outer membrane proteins